MAGEWNNMKDKMGQSTGGPSPADWEAMRAKIDAQPALSPVAGAKPWFAWILAAGLGLSIGLGAWYISVSSSSPSESNPQDFVGQEQVQNSPEQEQTNDALVDSDPTLQEDINPIKDLLKQPFKETESRLSQDDPNASLANTKAIARSAVANLYESAAEVESATSIEEEPTAAMIGTEDKASEEAIVPIKDPAEPASFAAATTSDGASLQSSKGEKEANNQAMNEVAGSEGQRDESDFKTKENGPINDSDNGIAKAQEREAGEADKAAEVGEIGEAGKIGEADKALTSQDETIPPSSSVPEELESEGSGNDREATSLEEAMRPKTAGQLADNQVSPPFINPKTGFRLTAANLSLGLQSDLKSMSPLIYGSSFDLQWQRERQFFSVGLAYYQVQEPYEVNFLESTERIDSTFKEQIEDRTVIEVSRVWVIDSFQAGRYVYDTTITIVRDTNIVLQVDTNQIETSIVKQVERQYSYAELPLLYGYEFGANRLRFRMAGGLALQQAVSYSDNEGGTQSRFGLSALMQPEMLWQLNPAWSLSGRVQLRYPLQSDFVLYQDRALRYSFQLGVSYRW